MIRVLIVDDHPALRAGLTAVLRAEPGIVPLDSIGSGAEVEAALRRTAPDVVLLDYHLPGRDGLRVCRQIKRHVPSPAVLLYSAYADARLALPGLLAGVDGIVHKGAPANELYDALRTVARGDKVLPPVPRELVEEAAHRVRPEDLPVLSMALEGHGVVEVAEALRVEPQAVGQAVDRLIAALAVEVPTPTAG